jgi:phage regulator Rha-like protein
MLSSHLAKLYGVEVRALIQAVKRNIDRFPKDFMFQLNKKEFEILKSQFVISRWGGARRSRPYAFTEQGVAMLSSILNSKRAIQVNISIMRAFVRLRELMITHKKLAENIHKLEKKYKEHDEKILIIFRAIKQLLSEEIKPSKRIGFHAD